MLLAVNELARHIVENQHAPIHPYATELKWIFVITNIVGFSVILTTVIYYQRLLNKIKKDK